MSKNENNKIGFFEVAAIGIGGMVGGGIFAVLGNHIGSYRKRHKKELDRNRP